MKRKLQVLSLAVLGLVLTTSVAWSAQAICPDFVTIVTPSGGTTYSASSGEYGTTWCPIDTPPYTVCNNYTVRNFVDSHGHEKTYNCSTGNWYTGW
jgi:hypothetical protein